MKEKVAAQPPFLLSIVIETLTETGLLQMSGQDLVLISVLKFSENDLVSLYKKKMSWKEGGHPPKYHNPF